jgi:hypothetical protein
MQMYLTMLKKDIDNNHVFYALIYIKYKSGQYVY